MRALAEYVMLGRKQAAFLALLFACIPFCNWLSVAIIGLVTLRKGISEGAFILGLAALPAVIIAIAGNVELLINNVLFDSLIVLGMAGLLRYTASWSILLQMTALIAVLAIVIAYVVTPDLQDWWLHRLNSLMQTVDMTKLDTGLNPVQLKKMMQTLARIATGIFAFTVIATSIIKLVIARGLQAMLYNSGGLKRELYQIRLGPGAAMLLMLALLGAANKQLIALNALPVLVLIYAIACFSLWHRVTALTQKQTFLLAGFYTLSIIVFPASIGALVVVAFVDSWINISESLQNRLAKK